MTYAFVNQTVFQTPSGGGTGSSNANGGSAIDTTGASFIAAIIGGGKTDSLSISDNYGNTWTPLTSYTTGSGNNVALIAYVQNPTVGAGHVITLTCNPSSYLTCNFISFSGAATSSVFDVQNGASVSGNSMQPGSITPSQNGSLILTAFGPEDVTTCTIDSGFSTPQGAGINGLGNAFAGFGSYLIQTTAAAVNPTWSGSTGGGISASIAAFKPGGAAPPAPANTNVPRLLLMGVG